MSILQKYWLYIVNISSIMPNFRQYWFATRDLAMIYFPYCNIDTHSKLNSFLLNNNNDKKKKKANLQHDLISNFQKKKTMKRNKQICEFSTFSEIQFTRGGKKV